jgi:phage/plasmid-like protein (TIGR03299 family)
MSKETAQWLHQNVKRGMTEKYGPAWWLDEQYDPTPSSHYDGPVPYQDVEELFGWDPVVVPVAGILPDDFAEGIGEAFIGEDASSLRIIRTANERILVLRSDTGADLGAFKEGYKPHPYRQWLMNNVRALAQGGLLVSTAGLIKGGAVAWVQFETDELNHVSGVRIRPHLLATTSLDGSLATTYLECDTDVVCDNTHAGALRENTAAYKTFHSSDSEFDDEQARRALGILARSADEWNLELDLLTTSHVTGHDWDLFLKELVEVPEEKGPSRTIAEKKVGQLRELYRYDNRVSPWAGSAWGVLQAVNTWETHFKKVSGAHRFERQMDRAVKGQWGKVDRDTLTVLDAVQGGAISELRERHHKLEEERHLVPVPVR